MVKRAIPERKDDRKDHLKRAKNDNIPVLGPGKFLNADDVRAALGTRDAGELTRALTTLRNQLTIHSNENVLTPQDERLLLVKGWLDKSPAARDIFSIIDSTPHPTPAVLSLSLVVLSSLLNLLSNCFIYHSLGEPIIKTLLSQSYMRRLNSNLSGASSELILSTLKVFNALSTFAAGAEQRALMDGFSWGQKSLQKLLFMRRKGKGVLPADPMARPDIRTLYISFILSFLSKSTPTPLKLSLLEQHRDVFLLIFKGISQDPYAVARSILEVCWEGVWNDPKIKRTLKIGLFNETTLNHLVKLYGRDSPEDDSTNLIPADLIHHFMLALTTHPGVGICFKDRGWYPRDYSLEESTIQTAEMDAAEGPSKSQGGKIYNKILANVVKGLKINEDARQQELALKILEACPELVTGYWSAANLTLEPRLSSRWITNISVFRTIISLPIPTSSFLLPHSLHHNPSPPPVSSTLANILPSVLTKGHLTKGLQSLSSLVQHCTALALSKCLAKLYDVLNAFRKAAQDLEEEGDTGQWSKRSRDLKSEVEKRIPDFMVIIAMVQQKHQPSEQGKAKAALLTESALRLLWLYHKLFPRLVAEVRFDVGKLLLNVVDPTIEASKDGEMDTDEPAIEESHNGLDVVRQLHVLRLLKESDQFAWSGKTGSSHSYLHAIFTIYTKTAHPAVRGATSNLLLHLLSSSIVFSHDPAELTLWLGALPLTRRGPCATGPDGTLLSDESAGVLAFLDDCIQRCTKTPYRYVEESLALFPNTANDDINPQDVVLTQDSPNTASSPLLMTVLEQLRAKIAATLLSPSDTLAIVTFIRKLACSMTCKQPNLLHARKVGNKLEEILSVQNVAPNSLVIRDAIKRECDLLSHTLHFIEDPVSRDPVPSSPVVLEFLERVEDMPAPSSHAGASIAAYELVDWMRLIHPPLHPSDANRLFGIILRFLPSAIEEFFYQLDPQQGQLWCCLRDNMKELEPDIPFEWAYLHSTPVQVAQTPVRDLLVSLFFSDNAWGKSFQHRVAIIMHRLAKNGRGEKSSRMLHHTELSLLTSIMRRGRSQCSKLGWDALKKSIFVDSRVMRELCCSHDISSAELKELFALVKISLDPSTPLDRELALEYSNYWAAQSLNAVELQSCTLASPWLAFMEPRGVIHHLDIIIFAVERGHKLTDSQKDAVNVILDVLVRFPAKSQFLAELQHRSRGLLAIRSCICGHSSLDALLLMIVEAGLPLAYNAIQVSVVEPSQLSDVTLSSQDRWNTHYVHLPLDSAISWTFLNSKDWTGTTAQIVSGTIYKTSAARQAFGAWLARSEPPGGSSLAIVAIALHAYLDVMLVERGSDGTQLPDPWFLALVRHLLHGQRSDESRTLCASCIRIVFEALPPLRQHYGDCLLEEVRNTHEGIMNSPLLRLVRDLYLLDALPLSELLVWIGDAALEWMARRFSDGMISDDDISIVEELTAAISPTETKAHLVEHLLKVVVQSCLHIPSIIRCVIPLVLSTHLKPAIVNRQLQGIVQHSQLYRVADPSLSTREPVIKLLHTLFHIHPSNTCQPSHIVPLTRLYGGTLSLSDRLLFSIFYLYEKQRRESTASIFRHWSPLPSGPSSQDAFGAITSLDPSKVFRTCSMLPTRRRLDVTIVSDTPIGDDGLYDPVFLTLLVAQMLSEHKELSTTDWVQMFRSNIISLVMCVLTSRDEAFRAASVSTLAGVLRRVQEADFLEKNQVIYIMDVLRDLLPSPSSTLAPPRLPTYSVMILVHALRSTFYPSSFLYPIVSRFLLQRPELDATDVPMLYSLLYSSEDGEWIKERTWMIRFLTEAIHEGGARDWAVLQRRHTWDLVASIWQSAKLEERALRRVVLEFLANLSSNRHAVTSLILRSSLLSWIEAQLRVGMIHDAEHIAWVKILENILVTADVGKADNVTRGEFRTTIIRCLDLLLRNIKVSDEVSLSVQIGLLRHICRVLLRVSIRPAPPVVLADVLRRAIQVLRRFESVIVWTTNSNSWKSFEFSAIPEPPHHTRELFEHPAAENEVNSLTMLRMWAESVATLWRVSMSLEEWRGDAECWNALTCRLLVLRASPMYYSQGSEMGLWEWARRETIKCLLAAEVKEVEMDH